MTPSTDGPLRPDLTPADLLFAGYTVREAGRGRVGFCWWRRNPYGRGQLFGLCRATVGEAVADARWLMRGQRGQMTLQGVTA